MAPCRSINLPGNLARRDSANPGHERDFGVNPSYHKNPDIHQQVQHVTRLKIAWLVS